MRVMAKGGVMELPRGYRLLQTAPGVWVLVDLYSTGMIVTRYEGELDHEQVEKDACEHADTKSEDGESR